MHTVILYFVKIIFCSALFYIAYNLLLSRTKLFQWNRMYLLTGAVLSLLIPFVRFPKLSDVALANQIYIIQLDELLLTPTVFVRSVSSDNILLAIYWFLVGVFLIRIMVKIVSLLKLKRNSRCFTNASCTIHITDKQNAPFSFFNTIFWRDGIDFNSTVGKCALRHELAHVKLGHSWDKLFLEILTSVFWLNPFFWLFQKELEIQHEYAADSLSIKKGESELAEVMLHTVFPGNNNFLVNAFAQSSIKKRIIMISSTQQKRFSRCRKFLALLVIPVAFILACQDDEKINADKLSVVEQVAGDPNKGVTITEPDLKINTENRKDKLVPFSEVAVKPSFQGEDVIAFSKWVNSIIIYPEEAVRNKIAGTVIYQIEIDSDGNLGKIELIRSANTLLDQESLRVLKMSPKWTPGKDARGNRVAVSYQFPIKFSLQ